MSPAHDDAKEILHAAEHPLETVEEIVGEVDQGRNPWTPFVALTGVAGVIAVVLVIVLVLSFLAYWLAG